MLCLHQCHMLPMEKRGYECSQQMHANTAQIKKPVSTNSLFIPAYTDGRLQLRTPSSTTAPCALQSLYNWSDGRYQNRKACVFFVCCTRAKFCECCKISICMVSPNKSATYTAILRGETGIFSISCSSR